MPEIEIRYNARVRGPISDGRMDDDAAAYAHDVAKELADEGYRMVMSRLGHVLKHPTGYYESKIDTKPISSNRYEIHDGGIVYGPWLEGTGSRNRPRPGFPGYHTFQVVENELNAKRQNIARRILREYRSRGKLI